MLMNVGFKMRKVPLKETGIYGTHQEHVGIF